VSSLKPVIRRHLAAQDIQEALDYYMAQPDPLLVEGFIGEFEKVIRHIQRHPGTGSPRYAQALGLPGLQVWSLKRFPYLVFYVEKIQHIDVWRILHAKRDIPAWLAQNSFE
jgi:toxin ParE1/3/4